MRILHVVGARPNFMKAAPVILALQGRTGVSQAIVHTGQHYDRNMSEVFFEELGIPRPDVNLEVGSGSHAVQTAQIMMRFEEVVLKDRPDWVVVYGDINSTAAATLVCAKLGIHVAHVEAGLRSRDRTMPEEINRLVTDQLADLLLTPSPDGGENLLREGIPAAKIRFVGNAMIDTLIRLLPTVKPPQYPDLAGRYVLVTLHRPSNVDDVDMLRSIVNVLTLIGQDIQVVFPVHPRTLRRLSDAKIELPQERTKLLQIEPVGYLEFLALQRNATVVITDSGGVQEETTYLGVPCITVRENTERPVTVTEGTNRLVGQDMGLLCNVVKEILAGHPKTGRVPELWDGRAGERIADELIRCHG